MRAVLDANVIVSAAYTFDVHDSSIAETLRQRLDGRYRLVTSDHILDEVGFALSKAFFADRLAPGVVDQIVEDIRIKAEVVVLSQFVEGVATHWQDDFVLSTALSGNARFLVTGDRELLDLDHSRPFRIVHPNEFAGLL